MFCSRQGLGEALLLALAAFAVYWLFGQESFYKADGQHLVRRLLLAQPDTPHHRLYMPLLIALHELAESIGMTAYQTAVLFSQLGVTAAVFFVHLGFCLLRLRSRERFAATVLFALNPAVFFFATVVEYHGPFLGFAALAFFCMAAMSRMQTWPFRIAWALMLGAATALSGMVHASGLALPALLLPWCMAQRLQGRSKRCRVVAFAAIPCVVAASLHVLGAVFFAKLAQSQQFLEEGFRRPQGIEYLAEIFRDEWLTAFLPLSLLAFVAFRRRELRLQVAALLLALVPYLGSALRLLVHEPERGAYLLPLAILAARLTAGALPGKLLLATCLLSATLCVGQVLRHDDTTEYRQITNGIRANIDEKQSVLLIGEPKVLSACLVFLPDLLLYPLDEAAKFKAKDLTGVLPMFDKSIEVNWAAGRQVYLTRGGEAYLADPANSWHGAGPVLLKHIREKYRLTEVKGKGFAALRLDKAK